MNFSRRKPGKGAFLNGQKIEVSKTPRLAQNRWSRPDFPVTSVTRIRTFTFTTSSRCVRMVCGELDRRRSTWRGGVAGRFDGFWEFNLNAWDTCAGILIVEEAGGNVTGMNGEAASRLLTATWWPQTA